MIGISPQLAALVIHGEGGAEAGAEPGATESAPSAPNFNAEAARADISLMAGLLQSRLHGIADGKESAAGEAVAGEAGAGEAVAGTAVEATAPAEKAASVGGPPGLEDFVGVYDAGPEASESQRFIKIEVEGGELTYTFAETREKFDDDSMKWGGTFRDIGGPETHEEFNDHNILLRPSGTHTTRTGQTTLKDGALVSEGMDVEDRAFNRDDKIVSRRSLTLDGDTLTFDESRTVYKKGFLGIGGYTLDPDGMNTLRSNPITYRRLN